MSNVEQGSGTSAPPRVPRQRGQDAVTEQTAWVGWVVFGAVMMALLGSFHVIAGLVAIFDESYFVAPHADLVVSVDYDTWGWTHLVGGLVVLAAGLGLLTGAMWARVLGVGVAMLSALVNIAFSFAGFGSLSGTVSIVAELALGALFAISYRRLASLARATA